MQHLKDQNWFAVGLDVIVVIVGIFLGMQVTEWNEERNSRLQERIYLESIINDLQQTIPELERRIKFLKTYSEGTEEAYRMLYFGELTEDTRPKFLSHYFALYRFTGFQINISTLLELQSGGKLDLIKSPELRKSFTAFLSEVDSTQYYYRERLSLLHSNLYQKISQMVFRTYDNNDLLNSNDELNNSKLIASILRDISWAQNRGAEEQNEMLSQVHQLNEEIKTYLNSFK